jgi:Prokaryotic RING finger family 1
LENLKENIIKSVKSTCTFCQTPIKNEEEEFLCPSCSSPYHNECWNENKGCAVYGCGEKLKDARDGYSLKESIINIEYLINRNQYSEAIFEAKQLLNVDRRNPELKNLYNKAVAIINNKINLMTSADEAFGKKDYKSAEVYYKNVLKYADEVETDFVNARLEIAKEKIPEQKRKRIYQNILIVAIILAILTAIGYLAYYTFVLKEDRDYSELVKSDNASDLSSMEKTIMKYENFLRNYPDGKNKTKALNKINQFAYQIASTYYKDDWKLALKYYKKIFNSMETEDSKVVYNNIYNEAFNDYKQKILNAKKLNSASKYSEALNELNNSRLILSSFPEANIKNENEILETNVSLLNKKILSIVKLNDLEREIRELDKMLNNLSYTGGNNSVLITARINKLIEPNIYVGQEEGSEKIIAIKSINKSYKVGQIVNLECITKGKQPVSDENDNEIIVPLYIPNSDKSEPNDIELSSSEREGIYERMRNLKNQKAKIDSLLNLNLL